MCAYIYLYLKINFCMSYSALFFLATFKYPITAHREIHLIAFNIYIHFHMFAWKFALFYLPIPNDAARNISLHIGLYTCVSICKTKTYELNYQFWEKENLKFWWISPIALQQHHRHLAPHEPFKRLVIFLYPCCTKLSTPEMCNLTVGN